MRGMGERGKVWGERWRGGGWRGRDVCECVV